MYHLKPFPEGGINSWRGSCWLWAGRWGSSIATSTLRRVGLSVRQKEMTIMVTIKKQTEHQEQASAKVPGCKAVDTLQHPSEGNLAVAPLIQRQLINIIDSNIQEK